jgi:hypothetical protein
MAMLDSRISTGETIGSGDRAMITDDAQALLDANQVARRLNMCPIIKICHFDIEEHAGMVMSQRHESNIKFEEHRDGREKNEADDE